MRQYEAVYIIDPGLEEDQQNSLVERFQTLVRDNGGEVQHLDRWERRRLAYEVKGRREGNYVVMNFNGEPAAEAELGRVFKITEGVIRHMIVKMDPRQAERSIKEAKAQAEAKAKAQAEAEVRAAAEAEAEIARQAAIEAGRQQAMEAAAAQQAAASAAAPAAAEQPSAEAGSSEPAPADTAEADTETQGTEADEDKGLV